MPLNGNYYCLLDDGVMEAQAELAKKYGVYGFCYYHYWFGHGKKLLEKPIERMLKNPNVDIPFCLSWDNNDWSKKYWDDGSSEIIAAQDFRDKDNLDRHIDYLCEFFADPRYIKLDGKPIFVIYVPYLIPKVQDRMNYVHERVKANGFPGIIIAAQHPGNFDFVNNKCKEIGVDAYIQSQPAFCGMRLKYKRLKEEHPFRTKINFKARIESVLRYCGLFETVRKVKNILMPQRSGKEKTCMIRDYDLSWEEILSDTHDDERFIASAFIDYDDTPRRKNGSVFIGVAPEKFRSYMRRLVQKVKNEYSYPYIFLNAWNEWAEGAYLEPDERYGYAYLEALRDALSLQ